MHITQITAPGPDLDALYRDVLAPMFPADELDSLENIRTGLSKGTFSVYALYDKLAATDATEVVMAGAVGQWFAEHKVMLLSYLAARSGGQSKGYGSQLLAAALKGWAEGFTPQLILAEVEDPLVHKATQYGDPRARVKFYERFHGLELQIPYFQPRFTADRQRVMNLMLVSLYTAPAILNEGAGTIKSEPVRGYVRQNLVNSEGSVGADEDTQKLLASLTSDVVHYAPLTSRLSNL